MVAGTTTTRRESRTWPSGSTPRPGSRRSTPAPPRHPDRSRARATRSSTTSTSRCSRPTRPAPCSTPRSRRSTAQFKEARRGAADYMAMEGEFAKYLQDVYSADPVAAGGAHRRVRHPRRRRRVRRAAAVAQAERGRLRRRPLLREGRRRRRHLVLEPLPGHRLRRRVLQLLPAARGDGLRPVDEVRLGLRDPRVLPEDGRPSSASTTTACSTPPSRRPSGTRRAAAGPSTPTAATPCGPAS